MAEPLIILGMHRSGTSAIAALVKLWGAYSGGDEKLLPADEWNREGYWEYLPLLDFNEHLLECIEASWLFPPPDDSEKELGELATDREFSQRALTLIREMETGLGADSGPWFWKDPRLGILLPFWKSIWRDPVYLIMVRHPLSIARSLQARFYFPVSASLLLWQQYITQILRHTSDSSKVLFIEYETLVAQPESQCARLKTFLDAHYPAVQSVNDAEVLAAGVKGDLSHHAGAAEFACSVASESQIALYQFLRRQCEERSEFVSGNFAVYPGWREYLKVVELLHQWWLEIQQRPANEHRLRPVSEASRRILGI